MKRKQQSGVALVITLIMVSVIAFMAITFLVLSTRERGSVSTASDQTDARLAAESALQRATAQLLAPIIVSGNPDNYDLLVSTNYINPLGFDAALAAGNGQFTNINFEHTTTGGALNNNQQLQNLTNLLLDPRPPVYLVTNKQTGGSDFRFYVDLNRNGRYDTNGIIPVILHNAASSADEYLLTNGLTAPPSFADYGRAVKALHVGDPEWIGVLERPELPHSSSNKFIARYAYLALPVGKTLDVNFIHNYATRNSAGMVANNADDGFLRNQGIGSWELNLAAFLSDLNTNNYVWRAHQLADNLSYNYETNNAGTAGGYGTAFSDALDLLRWRYATNFFALTNPVPLNDDSSVDEYVNGPLMAVKNLTNDLNDNVGNGYPGADNPNRFFTPQDLFNAAKGAGNFATHLGNAGAQTNSYDRYTYYRLLSQLGTDSTPESGKINLNYDNLTVSNGVADVTNYLAWTPLAFFTNAADKLLKHYSNQTFLAIGATNYPGSLTNIPLYPTNSYTPSVHHALQLAANIYDATTTNRFPSVFKPFFGSNLVSGTNTIFIGGYTYVDNADAVITAMRTNAIDVNDRTNIVDVGGDSLVYGVPLVIGARRGLPNFNEFAMQNVIKVSRNLEFYNPNAATEGSWPAAINQMYVFSISNNVGVELWNSYAQTYTNRLLMLVKVDFLQTVTNELGIITKTNVLLTNNFSSLVVNNWQGFVDQNNFANSFKVPGLTNQGARLSTNNLLLQQSYVKFQDAAHTAFKLPYNGILAAGSANADYPIPHWWVNVNVRLQALLVDTSTSTNRIIDFVTLSKPLEVVDVYAQLTNRAAVGAALQSGDFWLTNLVSSPAVPSGTIPAGIKKQIDVSTGTPPVSDTDWKDFSTEPTKRYETTRFARNYLSRGSGARDTFYNAPFTPGRVIYQDVIWRANDPLVHYLVSDLSSTNSTAKALARISDADQNQPLANFNNINPNYSPWPGTVSGGAYVARLEYKDPLVNRSDDWNFPTNKLPNVGWLGRVHRGTPWQTVYLKSSVAPTTNAIPGWTNWSGDTVIYFTTDTNAVTHYLWDATLTHPTNDWSLFDMFTAAPNANATRGRLNVNQTNLASWSAVLSGVLVLTNIIDDSIFDTGNPTPDFAARLIDPAGANGANSELAALVQNLNDTRTNGVFNGRFNQLGDVLAVPALTVNSPFLNRTDTQRQEGISEAAYERIPQQILGLLRGGEQPRFVIYAYGQSLKPADRSIISSGLCTNYQITSEIALRAVVTVNTNESGGYRTTIESYNPLPPD